MASREDIEDLADQLINLSPQESEQLAIVIKAKMMPEIERQKGLLDEENRANMQNAAQVEPSMQPPTAREVALQGLIR